MNPTGNPQNTPPNDIGKMLRQAVLFHQAGEVQRAVEIYETILANNPGHCDALHLRGFAFHQQKKNDRAFSLIQKAIQICPDSAPYHNSLGLVLKALGKTNEAITSFERALTLDPNLVEAHNNLGVLLQDLNRLEEAASHFDRALGLRADIAELYNNMGNIWQARLEPKKALAYYQKAVHIEPEYAEAHYNMGRAYQEMDQPLEALGSYQKAVNFRPGYPEAFHNMGNVYQLIQKPSDAICCYRKSLELSPESVETVINLGMVLEAQGRYDEAILSLKKGTEVCPRSSEIHYHLGTVFRNTGNLNAALASFAKALELNPDYADAWHSMGIVCQQQGDLNRARHCYQKTLALRPGYPEAHHNIGTVFQLLGKTEEAVLSFNKALDLKADQCQSHISLGNIFKEKGQLTESASCYRKAIETDPNNAKAYCQLLHLARETCDWPVMDELAMKVDLMTSASLERGEKPAEMPFLSLMRETNPSVYLAIARAWSYSIAQRMGSLAPPFSFKNRTILKEKITVGYLSNTFRNHPGSHLIQGLFKLHNRQKFNVFCYSYGKDDGSSYRKRIQQDCDRFVDLREMGHADAAGLIYNDKVDILVDLRGHTKGNPFISALRPAPIQINYLGYPGTTGADFFDYMITDKIVVPDSDVPYFSENLVVMPHCYQINDHEQPISGQNWKRSDFNVPENAFVFCSFNGPNKIEPVMFDAWMRILHQIPESVLWLLHVNDIAERNLVREADKKGIAPERLIFSKGLPKTEHLRRHQLADLALDTRIYNGHTTTSDALWAGVPVVTMTGGYFPSRVSASILSAAGLPELITHNIPEYEALAVSLARNPLKLGNIRKRLAENRLTAPLFDTPRFARNLEKAYSQIWNLFLTGSPPQNIQVPDL